MRDSLFNPFMPLTSLAGSVVFGGGGGGGGNVEPPSEPDEPRPAPTYTSDYPELAGQVYSSIEDRDAAEARIDAAKGTTYTSDVDFSDLPSISDSQTKLAELQASPVDDPGEFEGTTGTPEHEEYLAKKAEYDSYKSQVEEAAKNLQYAQTAQGIQSQQAAREMTQTALTDPSALVNKAETSMIDPNAEGTTVAEGTGQLTGIDPQATTTKVETTETADAPDTVTAATYTADTAADKSKEALEGKLNPQALLKAGEGKFRKQEYDPETNTYEVTIKENGIIRTLTLTPEEYAQRAGVMLQDYTEGGVKTAKGEVSDEAQVTAAQGELSFAAKARAAGVDEKYIQEVIAGTRQVSADELAEAAGIGEEAAKAMIAEANLPKEMLAATTEVQEEEKAKAAKIEEANMATAEAIVDIGLDEDAKAIAAKLDKFSVDDGTLAEFKEGKIEAQDTVQGQLAELMKSFDDGTPVWAAGAMRAANAAMAARGLGASSMASAAIVQAAMESAIPIAAADAEAFRTMKMDNLNRQQQVALANAAAQQGVELANFNAEQQAALQNSQNAFALQSQNLSNMQQAVIATAQIKASLQGQNLSNEQQANLAVAARFAEAANMNLSNRQQALLTNNQNELQVNLANLSAKQQAYIVNAQLESALQGKIIDNKQQTAIANAARFAEANNLTFTAEQQAQLHNSTLMQTIGLQEMSAKNAAILQNAASVAAMDMANLDNKQQAAVQNAQAFLQMDMANLTNEQQTAMFKAQALQQSILSDQAANNAALQFNASSENQTNQFMAQLKTQVDQFNAAQKNATEQFNAGQENATSQFNTQIQNQRDQFNANNALVVAQANAQWRQNAETINNAAQNEANLQAATAANAFTQSTLDQIWQRERDLMDYSFKASETSKDRALELVLADKQYDAYAEARDSAEETAKWQVWTNLLLS